MSKIAIKYRCQHISCRKPSCYEGSLFLNKDRYALLVQDVERNSIRSPSGYCSLGTPQKFEILSLVETPDAKASPEEVLKLLKSKLAETMSIKEKIEQQIGDSQRIVEQANKNILELNQRIVELSSKIEKKD
jgi:hypothetical protein